MNICLYGSSSEKTPEEYTDVGYELGLKIAEKGHSLVFGGGDNGMMGAVASGVFDGGAEITAIAPRWMGSLTLNSKIAVNILQWIPWMRERNCFWKNQTCS